MSAKPKYKMSQGAPWNSIPGSNTQFTVAYFGPLDG